ncbi:MAG TPA: hypothetical protein VF121_04260 [Thermoanaerobaculia bacterium]|nr:hypothetical protein [Thermoanaerobaculia bacterium]
MTLAAAAVWGFAEATVFFVVPDVLLTWVAVGAPRAALRACMAALAGALLGGWLMVACGARDPAAARALLDRVPAISPGMIERVEREIAEHGAAATIVGPLRGTPYKIYAVLAGARGEGVWRFLAVSVPARLPRFLLLTLVAAWVSQRPLRRWSLARKRALLAALWGVFYAAYFALMPN